MFVDVTDLIDRKVDMLACHKSQKDWLDESQGLGSYLDKMKELGAEVASMSSEPKLQYAEGWRKHLHLGFCDADDDPLAAALDDKVTR